MKCASPNSPQVPAAPGFSDCGEHLSVQIQPQQLTRKTVDHVDVLFANIQRARQASVLNFADIFPVLVKDLDSLILAVGNPQQTLRVDGDPVSNIELTGLSSF